MVYGVCGAVAFCQQYSRDPLHICEEASIENPAQESSDTSIEDSLIEY